VIVPVLIIVAGFSAAYLFLSRQGSAPLPTPSPTPPSPGYAPKQTAAKPKASPVAQAAFTLYSYLKAHGFDGKSARLILPFQKLSNLPVTGIFDNATSAALFKYSNDLIGPDPTAGLGVLT